MTELELFKDKIADKSVNTQKAYITQYNKLYNLLKKNIAETSER